MFAKIALLCANFLLHTSISNAAVLGKRDLLIPTGLLGNWSYSGCWTDNVPGRVLPTVSFSGSTMTNEICIAYCDKKNYIWAGTEYSGECYCSNTLLAASLAVNETECGMACSGNSSEACGGPNRLTLFNAGRTPPGGPYVNTGPGDWTSLGCYLDSTGARTLESGVDILGGSANMSVTNCVNACSASGYILAGVEYSGECYCGNELLHGNGPAVDGSIGCNMACNGNSAEFCGGPNRLNMYTTLGWKYEGCYNDSVAARTLSVGTPVPGGGNAMTIGNCTAACHAGGYIYAGLEYAGECYCDNVIENSGSLAPVNGDEDCTMPCNGDSTQICGGPNRLSFFKYRGDVPIFSSTTMTTTQSMTTPSTTYAPTSSTTTIFATSPIVTSMVLSSSLLVSSSSALPSSTAISPSGNMEFEAALPEGWTYDGCYIDNASGRIFAHQQSDSSDLTVESCVNECANLGYTVAGMEYSRQCFCDNYIRNNGTTTKDSDCSMVCSGNSHELCGAGNRLSVYSNSTVRTLQNPVTQTTNLPGSWNYMGCLMDGTTRTFPWQLILTNNNTATTCLTQCSTYGYNAGGMEYGDECFCGDADNVAAAGRSLVAESDCSMACSGNASYLCGAGNRISYYTWTGEPLTDWNYAEGAAAGEYQFLIGGVVVPLVTTQGVNGKVTFLEKAGTGPPNSTGAYELDLDQLSNFTGAWRPMHVQTDVFCSASLVLPDKVGRQINIGGWSDDSTYGVRLYWPDGSLGEWGVNDWQENVGKLHLQVGRWYPSAMVMANGSVLVVGGEQGSNGAPQPTLEILPLPAGASTVYCDWLERTDPYNLYPFLAVLPTGGIFVAYYNEARILDEDTFDTVLSLPNIPAAVNNILGGRTYPFSGTMMLMPQIAPYDEPLTVLICGGSTPGPALALDNCVSIQPEVANAEWIIERMPSPRVISCITALPDGTFLILNGGQQGTAGFGLASTPNLNAVLYDPSAPVHARMTVMANTTVARLYHSEAILLQDGRILVSGSDPEDNKNPQEYRVEVFVPPYLLSGLPQPTFSISETDWSYGQRYYFTLGTNITDASAIRVSLLGAESSTHGVSMGQRTLFPAASCNGVRCTVTAPPNAHVATPGWYQMFVLEGPTPSVSVYIRLGGDPAGVGNWPAIAGFDVPGI